MKSKFIILFIASIIFNSPTFSQTHFKTDAFGFIDDVQFSELIKERDYEFVGRFKVIDKKSKIKYAKFLKYGLWGYINLKGEEIMPAKYIEIDHFGDNAFRTTNYKYISNHSPPQKCGLGGFTIITKHIIINSEEELIYTNDHIELSNSYKTKVRKNNKWGVINKQGKQIVPCKYDDIKLDHSFIFVNSENKWKILNKHGVLTSDSEYDAIKRYNDFLLGYCFRKDQFTVLNSKTGRRINALWFDNINFGDFNTINNAHKPTNQNVLIVKQKGHFFMINKKAIKISESYSYITQISKTHFKVKVGENKFGLINDKGKIVANTIYDYIGNTNDPSIFYSLKDGKYAYHNKRMKQLPINTYQSKPNFNNGLGLIKHGDNYGFINTKSKLVFPAYYDGVTQGFQNKKEAIVRKSKKWGVINRKGKIIIPFEFDNIRKSKNVYLVKINDKWGVINKHNEIVIPVKYQNIQRRPDGFFHVMNNGKYGIIDKTNVIILPLIYDKINLYNSEGLIVVEKDNQYGCVNKNGKIIIPIEYNDVIRNFYNGVAIVSKNDGKYIIDKYGHSLYYESRTFKSLSN